MVYVCLYFDFDFDLLKASMHSLNDAREEMERRRETKAAEDAAVGEKRRELEEKVRDLQARLKQIGWFGEKVTGYYGSVTASAVSGFQFCSAAVLPVM